MAGKFICNCYFQRNIFLKHYGLHVHFYDSKQFEEDYSKILKQKGCIEELSKVIDKVKEEITRRKENGKKSSIRKQYIEKHYVPLHMGVYYLQESFLHEDFLKIIAICKEGLTARNKLLDLIKKCTAAQVYSFPVFTSTFCQMFIEELKHFENSDMPKGRPNTMNTTGFLLEELGFYPNFIDILRTQYLMPIATILYPQWTGVSGLDTQRAFIVSYNFEESGDETDLSLHYDNAEVTLNISLTDNFKGGELFFNIMRQELPSTSFKRVEHQKSHGILHRGQHMHGAMPIDCGERYNLIIWMRSSSIRNTLCPMCDEQPTLIETIGDGDGFTKEDVDVCKVL